MKLNRVFRTASELPATLPVFPLGGALLLPRRPMQLNVFETRYLAMLDDALSGERFIGIIQPRDGDAAQGDEPPLQQVGCAGRIVQYAESGDGRCFLTLMGVARFRVAEELPSPTRYRVVRPDYEPFSSDLTEGEGEQAVDREGLVAALKTFAEAHDVSIDWKEIKEASTEALVNGLSMLSPYGWREKQALLEARDLKARAETLVAISQMELARDSSKGGVLH